ncbi:hypothetical protein FOXYSP1_20741 [Fusarium oxysporum f. sp. phaseoli]
MTWCKKPKISCAEQGIDMMQRDVSIVFVTPESAMTKRLPDFLEPRRVMTKVDGIVVNDYHSIMGCSLSFRPKLRQLDTLASVWISDGLSHSDTSASG